MADNCTYCGAVRKIQDDHIIAQVKGGVTTTPACASCNQSKGSKALMEWLKWLKQNDTYRWKKIKDNNFGKKNPIAVKVQKIRDEN